jgi:hypothetical protein
MAGVREFDAGSFKLHYLCINQASAAVRNSFYSVRTDRLSKLFFEAPRGGTKGFF